MHPKTFLAGFFSIALLLGLSLLRFHLEPSREGGRPIWRGYRTLLIAPGEDIAEAQALLERRGYGVLSLENQRVSIYDYDQWQNFPLTAVSSVMDSLDPRVDPYISELPGYFYAWEGEVSGGKTPWHIFYVETTDSPGRFDREIALPFSEAGITYALPELEGMDERTLWLLGGLFFFSLALVLGRRWWHIFFILLPWAASVINGRPEILFSNNLAALSLVLIHRELLPLWRAHLEYPLSKRDMACRIFSSARPGFLLFGFSLILLVFAGAQRAIPGMLVGSAAQIGWIGGELAFIQWRRFRRIHRLYRPLLLRENPKARCLPLKRGILLGTVLLILPLAALLGGGDGGRWFLPMPEIRGGKLSWENLEALWEEDSPEDLPNLADFLTHRAYQEGFFYGGTYEFPRFGEALKSTRYTPGAAGIGEDEVALLEFTDRWYVDVLMGLGEGGITSLLLRQNSPAYVALKLLTVPKPAATWVWLGIALGLLCGAYPGVASFVLRKRGGLSWGRPASEGRRGDEGAKRLRRYSERTGAA